MQPLLKPSSRETIDPLIMECDVIVRDKKEFIRVYNSRRNMERFTIKIKGDEL